MKQYHIVTPCYHLLAQIDTLVVVQSLAQLPTACGYRFESIYSGDFFQVNFPFFFTLFLILINNVE